MADKKQFNSTPAPMSFRGRSETTNCLQSGLLRMLLRVNKACSCLASVCLSKRALPSRPSSGSQRPTERSFLAGDSNARAASCPRADDAARELLASHT